MSFPKSFLFIGNSATHVNNLPATFASLCDVTSKMATKDGYFLKHLAEDEEVCEEIKKGYDVVFFQDNGGVILSDEERKLCKETCEKMTSTAKKAGSDCWFYVRPPYGHNMVDYTNLEQSILLDEHFTKLSEELDMNCAYVNRAFSYAIKNYDIPLYGPDNAHTSIYGAYLAVCVFYTAIFKRSATELEIAYGLSKEDAEVLQKIADKISLEGFIPW